MGGRLLRFAFYQSARQPVGVPFSSIGPLRLAIFSLVSLCLPDPPFSFPWLRDPWASGTFLVLHRMYLEVVARFCLIHVLCSIDLLWSPAYVEGPKGSILLNELTHLVLWKPVCCSKLHVQLPMQSRAPASLCTTTILLPICIYYIMPS